MKKDVKIRVFSYLNCVNAVVNQEPYKKFAIISIQDAEGFGFEFKPVRNCVAVETIFADDADTINKTVSANKIPNIDSKTDFFDKYKLFSEEDAQRIANLVKSLDDVDEIWVHCYAGISRSSAVAAAISKYLTGDDSLYFNRYIPNMRVFTLTLEALFKEN